MFYVMLLIHADLLSTIILCLSSGSLAVPFTKFSDFPGVILDEDASLYHLLIFQWKKQKYSKCYHYFWT